jgi:hypothetical protein
MTSFDEICETISGLVFTNETKADELVVLMMTFKADHSFTFQRLSQFPAFKQLWNAIDTRQHGTAAAG